MKDDLTTLQLAVAIARAVYLAVPRDNQSIYDAGAEAVLCVLDETNSWFCRLRDTQKGTVETAYEQVELFP